MLSPASTSQSGISAALLLHSAGKRRGNTPDIVPGESVSDNGSPAACSELNHPAASVQTALIIFRMRLSFFSISLTRAIWVRVRSRL